MNNLRQTARSSRPLVFVGLAALAMLAAPAVYERFYAARWFRDFSGLAPFHSVTMTARATEGGAVIDGTMVKRRCEFQGLTAYITRPSGIRFRVPLDVSPEEQETGATGNRPAHPSKQHWGPWLIEWEGAATRWQVFAHHQCPDRQTPDTNLFAAGDWPE